MGIADQTFVRLRPEHVSNVAVIEGNSFALPWSIGDLRRLLGDADVVCVGALVEGALAAYGLGYIELEHFHLASMAVAPDYRRRGIGDALLRHLLQEIKERGCTRCTLEVRVGNSAARKLYDKAGFKQVRRMEGHYDDPEEDGLELALVVG